MSARRGACRRLSSSWQALANVLLLRVVVIYVPSVYINLSAAELAGLFQPGCLLRRLGDFSCLWDPERRPPARPCQVPAPDQQQQAAPWSRRHPYIPLWTPCPLWPHALWGEGSQATTGNQALGCEVPTLTLLPGFILLLLQQFKWLFVICSSHRGLFPSLFCSLCKEAAFSCRRQITSYWAADFCGLAGVSILDVLAWRDDNTQVWCYHGEFTPSLRR